ncbi:MAG: ABC transporter ATP-binding protein [Sphaerochaetaceae bacterium]|nr:ABC transporter ATP-binding protein [Sphaerochaetaceae bacterium]
MTEHKIISDINADFAVEMKNITKMFGSFTANENINLKVKRGEIHAVLGENGAGKTTLMNILYGLYQPTSGEIFINGEKKEFSGPGDAIKCGIGMVHQHFMLAMPFTVTENIILGEEITKHKICLDMQSARSAVQERAERYGMDIDPDAKIEDISVGMQQRVEILKVLFRGADILIFDEPTASLTPQEIEEFMLIIKRLASDGKAIILITHKLKEILSAADKCTIIRRGKYIDTVDVKNTSESELASLMVGRSVSFCVEKKESIPGDTVLEVKNLCARDYRGVQILNNLNLYVKRGEILGIAGVDGNGQSELVEILTGLRKADSGSILVNGKEMFGSSARSIFESGVSSIPEDRQKHGLILDFSVSSNLVLQNYRTPAFSKNGFLDHKKILSYAEKTIKKYDIRPQDSANSKASSLSGGNQQKVIIAREVDNDKDLLIAVNPTRGLDVGAIEYVHKYIVAQRDKGKAILLVSFELDEIINLSDRIDVIYSGRIRGELLSKDADEKTLGLMMAGGNA